MNQRALSTVLATTSLLVAVAVPSGMNQNQVSFARIYKLGEKVTYSSSHGLKGDDASAETLDVELTVKKLPQAGKAQIGIHFSNVHTSDPGDASTPDLTITVAANNMPSGFTPKDRSAEAILPFLFLGSATMDKPVKVGDEAPLSWHSDLLGFDGSIKVVDISADDKRIKALIKAKLDVQGNVAGDLTFNSTLDAADGSLLSSVGELAVGSMVQEFKFTRKQRSNESLWHTTPYLDHG